MLAKKFRLPFWEFYQKFDETFTTSYFTIKIKKNRLGYNRFGIILPTKVEKKSSSRHYLKRRLSCFLRNLPNFSRDFLIIALPSLKKISQEKNKEEINLAINEILEKLSFRKNQD